MLSQFSVVDGADTYHVVKATPPQTNDGNISVGKGAYCFVIDVSGRYSLNHSLATGHQFFARISPRPARKFTPRIPPLAV